MKNNFLISTIVALANCLNSAQLTAGNYRELVPAPSSAIDDEQELTFYLGPLTFRIKNKNLSIPFPRGEHPFDGSICGRPDLRERDRKMCTDRPRSVFLKFPRSNGDANQTQLSSVPIVTLGYKQNYNSYTGSADDFAAVHNTWDGGRVRTPRLDTQSYGAVQILPSKSFEKLPNWPQGYGRTYYFIGRGDHSPHVITCSVKFGEELSDNSSCMARTWFLTDEFPDKTDGRFAFSLEYTFPAAKIDQAPLIEQAVVNAVSELPRSRIK